MVSRVSISESGCNISKSSDSTSIDMSPRDCIEDDGMIFMSKSNGSTSTDRVSRVCNGNDIKSGDWRSSEIASRDCTNVRWVEEVDSEMSRLLDIPRDCM